MVNSNNNVNEKKDESGLYSKEASKEVRIQRTVVSRMTLFSQELAPLTFKGHHLRKVSMCILYD